MENSRGHSTGKKAAIIGGAVVVLLVIFAVVLLRNQKTKFPDPVQYLAPAWKLQNPNQTDAAYRRRGICSVRIWDMDKKGIDEADVVASIDAYVSLLEEKYGFYLSSRTDDSFLHEWYWVLFKNGVTAGDKNYNHYEIRLGYDTNTQGGEFVYYWGRSLKMVDSPSTYIPGSGPATADQPVMEPVGAVTPIPTSEPTPDTSGSGSSGFGSSSDSSGSDSRWTPCTKCHGDGKIDCSRCGGSGGKYVYVSGGPNYSGSGRSTSTRKWENCSKCRGSGEDTCTSCGGSGKTYY